MIQGFKRIIALLTSILKITELPDKPVFNKNDGSRSVFSRNNNNSLVPKKNNNNNMVNRFGISKNGVEYTKKSGKSKSKKTSKFQNLIKSKKKLSKSENSSNFSITKTRQKFLILDTKIVFNYL